MQAEDTTKKPSKMMGRSANWLVLSSIILAVAVVVLAVYAVNLRTINVELSNNLTLANQAVLIKEQEIDILTLEVSTVDKKVASTQALLDNFETDIVKSMSWFKVNSNIAKVAEYVNLRNVLTHRCVNIEGDTCRVKLACLPIVHEAFDYKYDSDTSNVADKLQSLVEFYRNRGGDCEDYSLVVNAELNYIQDYCEGIGASGVILETAKKELGADYNIDFSGKLRYLDYAEMKIPSDYIYHYMVCGNFPSEADPNSKIENEIVGHCALAFTDVEITGSSDVYNALASSIIVEPQTGLLLYDLRYGAEFEIAMNNTTYSFQRDKFVYAVVTDNDYYLFKQRGFASYWWGYGDFLPLIQDMRDELRG